MGSRRGRSAPPPQLESSIGAVGSWTSIVVLLLLVGCELLAASDGDDEACLRNLYGAFADAPKQLQNWSESGFSSPCKGPTSYLEGATCNNGRVYKLSLPNLSLAGTISPYISNCSKLQTLDLSSNSLTGPIPATLSSLLNLAVLNLSANRLSGLIPPQLGDCAYLNVIDLHSNRLVGPIPARLGLLARLSWLDVSDNRLEGPIPLVLVNRSGVRFNASSFAGNEGLYGYPLPPVRGRNLSILGIVGIGLASGLLSLVLSFTAVCVWLRMKEEKAATAGGEGNFSDH